MSATAACTSLLGTALFLRQSSKSYPHLVVHSLEHLRQQIALSVSKAFKSQSMDSKNPKPLELLDTPPLASATLLHTAYAHAFFEPRYGRLHIKEIHSFIHLIERLRSELSCASLRERVTHSLNEFIGGSTIPVYLRTPSVSRMYSAFEAPAVIMTDALCDALQLLEHTISYAFDIPLSHSPLKDPPNSQLYANQQRVISEAVRLLKLQLGTVHASLDRNRNDVTSSSNPKDGDFSKEVRILYLQLKELIYGFWHVN